VARIVDRDKAAKALVTIDGVEIEAAGEGTWGNRIVVFVKAASAEKQGFRLQLHYWTKDDFATLPNPPVDPLPNPKDFATPAEFEAAVKKLRSQKAPQLSEDFDDLVLDEHSSNFVEKRVSHGLSWLVEVTKVSNVVPQAAQKPLADGKDGDPVALKDYKGRLAPSADNERTGLAAFDEPPFEDIAIIYAPAANGDAALRDLLLTYCENSKYRFAILDAPPHQADIGPITPRTERSSNYGAFYYPWIQIYDVQSGAKKLVPPGGHVAGIYARSDIERGVFKAPANEIVRGALELEFEVTDGGQAILNPRGVNVIRAFTGRGRRVWGARTISDDPLWKYVNVRRLFIFIEASIFRGTQWVVFEPNNERLWARVKQTITEFLRTQFRAGALLGAKEEEAFFVKVDRSTMTDDDINNGRLIVVIGIAPVRPAEFVIFRIAQLTASATSVQL
jgi:hypothetical protein